MECTIQEIVFLHKRLGYLPFSPVLENLTGALNDVMSFRVMNEVVNSYATIKHSVVLIYIYIFRQQYTCI